MEFENLNLLLGALTVIFMFIVYLSYIYNRKFKEVNILLERVDLKFRDFGRRLDELKRYSDSRFDDTKKYVEKYVDLKLNDLKEYIDFKINESNRALSAQQEFLLEYLALRGVLSENEVMMFKNEAARLSSISLLSKTIRKSWEITGKKYEVIAE